MASEQLCFVFCAIYLCIYCTGFVQGESDGVKHTAEESSHDNSDSEEAVVLNYRLEIQPESPVAGVPLIRRVSENLTLTCRVVKEGGPYTKFTLEWHVPLHANNRINVQKPDKLGARQLLIKNLQESDSGYYHCMARNEDRIVLNQSVSIQVKPRKGSCGEGMFLCLSRACIPRRYLCDGFNDCPDGTDESVHNCGESPCDGKLHCEDGRCISPQYCCDRFRDSTCNISVQIPCCLKFFPSFNEIDLTLHNQQLNDIGFLQSTMYTIIGCAIAFVLIITFTVMAICHVHMRRSGMTASYTYRENGPTWNDLDAYLAAARRWNRSMHAASRPRGLGVTLNGGGGVRINDPASSTLLVTYNINNGVQFAGQPVNPPAYETIAQAPPQREEPPPPYTSHENLATPGRGPALWSSLGPHSALSTLVALLSGGGGTEAEERAAALQNGQLDHNNQNNNGDINGNSTPAVRVQPNSNTPAADGVSTINLPPTSQA